MNVEVEKAGRGARGEGRRLIAAGVLTRQGLKRHPCAAAADVFVGGRIPQEHAPPTKTQPLQAG
ncbi:MAG: hypothetical protein PHN94_00225 [Bacteroidales bacterium]|nr:hypothetical protein [Bacteroidales bacterium]